MRPQRNRYDYDGLLTSLYQLYQYEPRNKATEQVMEQSLQELAQKEARLSSALQNTQSLLERRRQNKLNHQLRYNANNAAPGPFPAYDVSDLFDRSDTTTVQGGGTLRTQSYMNPRIEFVQVMLKTEGRPMDADVQSWHGPDNTPYKMKVYVEDGGLRTFHALIGTPNQPNTVAIRNTGMLEFPLTAVVAPDQQGQDAALAVESSGAFETIQGGALRTYPFSFLVSSVAILLKTDGRPLNARIELLQGPNNNKQVMELYNEGGMMRPFFAIVETPGSGNVVRVVNTAPVEFPLAACVQAYTFSDESDYTAWPENGVQIGNAW
jgi:hypothetical protein